MLDASLARLFVGARVEPRIRMIDMLPGLAAVALIATLSCGDGTTEPPPPDPPRATAVTVTPAAIELNALGATRQLTAEVRDQNGQPMAGAAVSWSGSDASVATVDAQGLVTAAGNGMATVTAMVGAASGSATVTVRQVVSTVAVSPAADTVVEGDTLHLAAVGADANGHAVAGAAFTWSSSDTLVARVDDAGRVTGVAVGEAAVTAATDGVTGRSELVVVVPVPTTVAVTPEAPELKSLGQEVQLTAEVRDQIGRVMTDIAVSWSSGDTTVAMVDSAGLVTAVGNGMATVTATAGTASGIAAVTVGQVTSTDRASLEALYEGTGGPNWVNNDNWLTDAPLEDWYGVDVDGGGRVTRLHLNGIWNQEAGVWESNNLSGPIPTELGSLANLQSLNLGFNALSGPIPTEVGSLASLEVLQLNNNNLTGPIPPELGGLARLRELHVTDNSGMSGALPVTLTALSQLEALLAGGTGLCVPTDVSGFLDWLGGVAMHTVALCAASVAYLTQAVQSRELPVPLVAGEEALLRVFVTAMRTTAEGIPPVRASFYVNGAETHVIDIPGQSTAIPTEVDEGTLSKSANTGIPGEVVQPGLEMVIEIDPQGTLDAGLGVVKRIPETGRASVDVKAMPMLDLTLVPFLRASSPDSSILGITRGMAADPEKHELLWDTRTLLPVGDLDVKVHEPVLVATNNADTLLKVTDVLRVLEGGSGHYMGMMPRPVTGSGGGVAHVPGKSSFAIPVASTIAHELGHNLSLAHAPCATVVGTDPSFPYPDGSIGAWGYDFRDGGSLVPPRTGDLMSYCNPRWISDFHFGNALRFRLSDADGVGLSQPPPAIAAPATSLLLWGGVDTDGAPFLEPAFVVDAPPALPPSGGEYEVTGRAEGGGELFSFSFDMPEVADGDGSSSFAFALPVQNAWAGTLASITLSGPGGSVTLDRETDRPMAILRDPQTGQIRGFLRDLPPLAAAAQADAAAALSPEPGLDILISRGIPGAGVWRR